MGGPFFSILAPAADPSDPFSESLRAQTFAGWEMSPTLEAATGEFVIVVDQPGELRSDALDLIHQALRAEPAVDYLYTDEDRIDAAGRHHGQFAKPDWSPERFRTQMYTGQLCVLRRSLVDEVGGFDPDLAGARLWDLALRVTEQARRVAHIPEVLFHRRGDDGPSPATTDAAVRALQAHCDRTGVPAVVEADPERPELFHLQPRPRSRPLVSIIIPTAGGRREVRGGNPVLVHNCVRSIVDVSTYDRYEILCVVDDKTDPAVLDGLHALAGDRLRIVVGQRPFNFSERINLAALRAQGEHLVLLNDDIEIITPEWLERLLMYSTQPTIGAVGPKLLFGDRRLQHVGVTFVEGRPGHLYRGFSGDYAGYFDNTLVAHNYLAVTGACLMTSRDLFDELGGLSTLFPLNYNDIDYCLKAQAQGRRVVFDPDTVLYHFELSTRPEHVDRWEHDLLYRRWGHAVENDPYANASLLLPTEFVYASLARTRGS